MFQIIHLSDIHIREEGNSLFEKEEKIFDALKNETHNGSLVLIAGDSAFSGTKKEFKLFKDFTDRLKNKLEKYNVNNIQFLVIPGNHDCQNLAVPDIIRSTLLKSIQDPKTKVEIELVDQVSNKLENYFEYEKFYNSAYETLYTSSLLKVYRFTSEDKSTVFYCYNTAFQSVLNEVPGKMVLPLNLIDENVFKIKADLKISCFHHPFHWLQPEHVRAFKSHIENTSDFFFTGHEHISSKSSISDLENNITYHIEGDVLQDSHNEKISGFNLVNVDFESVRFQVKNFKWQGDRYEEPKGSDKWISFKRGAIKINNPYELNLEWKKWLNDIGANFTHPEKSKLSLSDVYVYPNLESMSAHDESTESRTDLIVGSKNTIRGLSGKIRAIFSGSENIGKTALLKMIFRSLHEKSLVPVFVDGYKIKSTSPDDFKKLLQNLFIEQYNSNDLADFDQLDLSRLVIIIDDFNRIKINVRYKARLLKNLIVKYDNIILSGNELMSLEDIMIDESIEEDLYSSFKYYEIKEFGHQLRGELINKWNILGVEQTISDEDRIRKLQIAENIVNTVTGVNFVPNYPFFILTILQSIELGNPTDLSASTFGHYYQFLIHKSFKNILNSQREITEYENYLSELSYYLLENSLREFDIYEFEKFDKLYRGKYTISHTLERVSKNLIEADIIENRNGILEYKYSYIHYFFVSNYLSNHLDESSTKELISSFIDEIHKSENSNILMFLTHHTKDKFLLEELLEKANSIFPDLAPCKLESDIQKINELGSKIPELVFESRSVDEYRDEENRLKDNGDNSLTSEGDILEDTDIEVLSQLNTAFKSMEIVGQILKNNYGKIENPTIEKLIESSILLGLRTLNVFFSIIEENTEYVINQVNSIIADIELTRGKRLDNPKKIESLSKSTLFGLCNQMSYSFIKKISDSIGTEYLNDILEKVYSKLNFNSVKLLKLAIKLDHYRGFPDSDLKRLKSDLEGKHLPEQVMKRLVINHLYLFPTEQQQKSRILNLLNIPIKEQLRIDKTSKQKK